MLKEVGTDTVCPEHGFQWDCFNCPTTEEYNRCRGITTTIRTVSTEMSTPQDRTDQPTTQSTTTNKEQQTSPTISPITQHNTTPNGQTTLGEQYISQNPTSSQLSSDTSPEQTTDQDITNQNYPKTWNREETKDESDNIRLLDLYKDFNPSSEELRKDEKELFDFWVHNDYPLSRPKTDEMIEYDEQIVDIMGRSVGKDYTEVGVGNGEMGGKSLESNIEKVSRRNWQQDNIKHIHKKSMKNKIISIIDMKEIKSRPKRLVDVNVRHFNRFPSITRDGIHNSNQPVFNVFAHWTDTYCMCMNISGRQTFHRGRGIPVAIEGKLHITLFESSCACNPFGPVRMKGFGFNQPQPVGEWEVTQLGNQCSCKLTGLVGYDGNIKWNSITDTGGRLILKAQGSMCNCKFV